jgi:hypothetical protein
MVPDSNLFSPVTVAQAYALHHATQIIVLFAILFNMFSMLSSYNATPVTVNIADICGKI